MNRDWSPKDVRDLKDHMNARPKRQYHTIAQLMDRTTDSIRNKVFALRNEGRNDWMDEERIGFFDIESSHLKANIGNMISYCIKPMGKPEVFNAWTRREAINWDLMDRRIMRDLIKELGNYDLIVTYYGTGFDNKFIRTRAMILRLPGFPTCGQLKHFDLYYAVKGRMSLYSNRLAVATQALGIHGKTNLPPEIWGPARLGDKVAMKLVEEHNREDVKILEELYYELIPFVKVIRKSI